MNTKIVKCSTTEFKSGETEHYDLRLIPDQEKVNKLITDIVGEIMRAYEKGESKKIFIDYHSITSDVQQPFSYHHLQFGKND